MSTDLTTYENLLAAITVDDGTAVHDPATGEVIGNTRVSTPADVDAAVARASQAQVSWGAPTHAERPAYLHKAAAAVNASSEARAQVQARAGGKRLDGPLARRCCLALRCVTCVGGAWSGRARGQSVAGGLGGAMASASPLRRPPCALSGSWGTWISCFSRIICARFWPRTAGSVEQLLPVLI